MILPDDISFLKTMVGGNQCYAFRHKTLGDIGRIRILEAPNDMSQLSYELAGDLDDPVTEQRKALFEPIAKALIAEMSAMTVDIDLLPPAQDDGEDHVFENETFACETCSAPVARIIYVPYADDIAEFEDAARILFPTFAQWPVPTWLIGPHDRYHEQAGPAQIMKIYPERSPLTQTTPDRFHPVIDALIDDHCKLQK